MRTQSDHPTEAEIARSQNMLAAILDEDDAPPGPGHNQPAESDLARERTEALIAAANKWLDVEVTTEELAARLADALNQLHEEGKKLEAARKDEKQPHIDAAKAVDDRWRPLQQMVDACVSVLRPKHSAWLRLKQARLDAERRAKESAAEKARREAEEAARKAAAPKTVQDITRAAEAQQRALDAAAAVAAVPDRAQSRGQLGGRMRSLRETWHASVEDIVEATAHYLSRQELRDLVTRLANADARAGVRTIPGCKIFSTKE